MDDSQRSANSRSFWIGTLCYLNSALVWGLNIPLTAALFASFDPFWLAPLRLTIASCLLAIGCADQPGTSFLAIPDPDSTGIADESLCELFLYAL